MARPGLVGFRVAVKETDLWVLAARDFSPEVREVVIQERQQLEAYIAGHPGFLTSLVPWPQDPFAPPVVREMIAAAAAARRRSHGRGGRGPGGPGGAAPGPLLSPEVIVENGGDILSGHSPAGHGGPVCRQVPLEPPGGPEARSRVQSPGGVHLLGQRGAFLELRPGGRRLRPGQKRRPGRCRGHRPGQPGPGPRHHRSGPGVGRRASRTSSGRSSLWARSWGPGAGWSWCPWADKRMSSGRMAASQVVQEARSIRGAWPDLVD